MTELDDAVSFELARDGKRLLKLQNDEAPQPKVPGFTKQQITAAFLRERADNFVKSGDFESREEMLRRYVRAREKEIYDQVFAIRRALRQIAVHTELARLAEKIIAGQA